jgi:CheY-like chemotaxis protein
MPDVDGLEVIRQLKAANPACRIIAISGGGRLNGSDIYLHLADVFGVDATLAKPFGIPELCDAVDGKAPPGSHRVPSPASGQPPLASPNTPSTRA